MTIITFGKLWDDFPLLTTKADVKKSDYAQHGYTPKVIIIPPFKEIMRILDKK